MHKVIRIAIVLIVCLILLNSLIFIGMGIYKSIHAYILLAEGRMAERPGVYIVEALDSFMITLFFIIFAIGISKLFLPNNTFIKGYDLPWLKAESFSALKLILWEVLLTTIFIYFATYIVMQKDELKWTVLIFPASILMISVAYKFLKQGH